MPVRTPPRIDDAHAAAYAEGLREHALRLQHCAACGFVRYPVGPVCPECWSPDFAWRAHGGEGEVASFVWYMQSLDPRFPEVPYNVALVRLDRGPVLVSNVTDVGFGELKVGHRVKATFSDEPGGFSVLLFEAVTP